MLEVSCSTAPITMLLCLSIMADMGGQTGGERNEGIGVSRVMRRRMHTVWINLECEGISSTNSLF